MKPYWQQCCYTFIQKRTGWRKIRDDDALMNLAKISCIQIKVGYIYYNGFHILLQNYKIEILLVLCCQHHSLPLLLFFCFPLREVVSPMDGHLSFSAFTVMSQGRRKLLPCRNPGKSSPKHFTCKLNIFILLIKINENDCLL